MATMKIGDRSVTRVPKALKEAGVRIDRVCRRLAYPRNGNVDRPTPEFRWEVFLNDGLVGSQSRLSKAVELAREALAETQPHEFEGSSEDYTPVCAKCHELAEHPIHLHVRVIKG